MVSGKRKAVYLDRDGVLNASVQHDGKPYPPDSLDELTLLAGAREACAAFRAAGALLFCVTNQPDVARGRARREVVEAMNAHLAAALSLDDLAVCYHDDVDDCACRKPRPGMLLDLASRHGVSLDASVMVGDRWRDIEAGRRAGCRTVFIDHGYDERRPDGADFEGPSLTAAAPFILKILAERP